MKAVRLHQSAGRLDLHQHANGQPDSGVEDQQPDAGHVCRRRVRQLRRTYRAEDLPCGDCG